MIEKFSEEEIKQLIEELKTFKNQYTPYAKGLVLRQEAEKVLGDDPYIINTISDSMFRIADFVTENYEKKVPKSGGLPKKYSCRTVPKDKEEEYRRILRSILEVIGPYYGMLGFRGKNGKKHYSKG